MSFEVVKMVFEHSKSRGAAQHILLALAFACNDRLRKDQGKVECFPSVAFLSKQTGMSYRSVWDQLNELRDLGEITWRNRPGHSNVYTLLVPLDEDVEPPI